MKKTAHSLGRGPNHLSGRYRYPPLPAEERFLTQDYIAQQTPYLDIIAEKYPGEFKTSMYRQSRIDYVYCTPALYARMVTAEIVVPFPFFSARHRAGQAVRRPSL